MTDASVKRVAVLGATGSIGASTISVLRENKNRFQPVLFSAHSNTAKLEALLAEFPASRGVLDADEIPAAIRESGADIVVNGISGAAGLLPSIAALEAGASLALANKETVCMAWDIVKNAANKSGAKIIPVDSEHSAVFSLINAHGRGNVASIFLTCSGGPFRNFSAEALEKVTPEDALKHPTWKMGAKISIDSATLANKGLEVIEAARLFDMSSYDTAVVIHPESVVHSLIKLKDGAFYAQLSAPDMRFPIHNALFYPDVAPCPFAALDFTNLSLTFSPPDTERFPMLSLAYAALEAGPLYTVAYNAANEVAVHAFLQGKIAFTTIARIVEEALQDDFAGSASTLDAVLAADEKARRAANLA